MMTLNSLSIRGENSAGDTVVTLREGEYLYPDGELLFGHSFPGIVVASLETSPGVWLQLWAGPVDVVATTIYSLRDDIFTYTVRRLMSTLGASRIRVVVQELDMPGGTAIDDWESMTSIEVLTALPVVSSYYTEMSPNYLFDTDDFLIATRITEMDANSHVMLLLNDKVFLLETDDNLNYTTIVPASDVGAFNLKKWELIVVGPGGAIVYPTLAADYNWMGIISYSRKVLILEGWTDEESVDDWNVVGDEIYTSWSSNKMLYIYMPCNVLGEQHISQDIYKMNADKAFEFNANLGMSSSLTEGASLYMGLFGDSDDLAIVKNLIGLKKYVEAGVHRLALTIIDMDGVVQTQEFTDPLEDFGDDVLYTVKVVWNPASLKLIGSLYKTDEDEELVLIEAIELPVTSLPNMEVDKYGVHYNYDATDIYERLYFGSTMLRIGNVDQTIHRVVDAIEVNESEIAGTDYHIVMDYYDYTTGEKLTADGDLTVDILDSEKETIATLSAARREDGKYESFWSTTGIPTGIYTVKVTGSLNGRLKVSKQLVSVENG